MDSRRTVEVLYGSDPVFQDFATRVLGADGSQQAWEMLYESGGISKMSPEPSEVHSLSGRLRPTGRRRKPMDDRVINKIAMPKKLPTMPKDVLGLKPTQAVGVGTLIGAGAYGGYKLKKTLGTKIRGFERIEGKRPEGDFRPNPAFGKSMGAGFNVVKTDEDKHQVFGWASIIEKDGVPVEDKQGDLIGVDDLENSAYKFVLESRKGGQQHRRNEDDTPIHVSDMIESFAVTPEKKEKMGLPSHFPTGWWVGFKVNDEETWQDVKSGKVKFFSVHGRGKRIPVEG